MNNFTIETTPTDVIEQVELLNQFYQTDFSIVSRGSMDAVMNGDNTIAFGTSGALLTALYHIKTGLEIGKTIGKSPLPNTLDHSHFSNTRYKNS